MWRSVIACLVALTAAPVQGAGTDLKPGLWELRVITHVIDGRDTSAEIAAANSQMQQTLATLPPEQRAQMEAMLKQRGGSALGHNGAIRMCITPELASRDASIMGQEGRCETAQVNRTGNRTAFKFSCTSDDLTTTGTGVSTVTGDSITRKLDATTREADGETHVIQSETEIKFLGSDCGGVKPAPLPKYSQ
jgi:hypothetical protein